MLANRWFSILVIALVALGGLFATPARAASPKGQISFYVFGDGAEKAAYETLVAAFNKVSPDVTVNLVYTPGEDEFHAEEEDAYRQRLSLDFASGKPPDVFLMNYREYGIFTEKDAIDPVGPYLDQSKLIKASDFYAEALQPFTRNKILDCIPQNASGTVVYYNKDLFTKAGMAYPKADWTWDDFLKTAQGLTTGEGKNIQYGLGIDPSFPRLMPVIWQNGGEVVDNVSVPTKIALDTPEAKAAMQWFVDLHVKYHVTPDEANARALTTEDRFLGGTMGMAVFSRRLVPALRQVKFDWDVAPLPKGKTSATLLYADGYCMAKGSQNKDAAWALIEYANSPEGQTVLAKTGRTVPSLKAVAESSAFLDPAAKPKNSQLFLDIIANIRTSPALDNYADIEEEVNRQLEGAFYGDLTVEQAIAEIMKNAK